MKQRIWFVVHKRLVYSAIAVAVLVLAVGVWKVGLTKSNAVPANIKNQVNFSIIYPRNYRINADDWNYKTDNKSLAITVRSADYSVVLTEQKVPLAYQNDAAAYNRFIGSLKPSANFDVPLGTVSITNFVTSDDYQVVGETAILNAKGTLLLAHPSRNLNDDEWRNLFNALTVD